jgi:hypothetical protein
MTALGKTLTVFVFLLSLVWCWLTVNAFATRTNWKTQAEAAKAQAVAAADRAREWEAEVTSLRAAAEAQAKKLADTIAERDRTIVALQKDNGDLKRDYDRKLAAEKDAEVKAALQLKNNQATLEQINGLKVAKDAVEKKLIDATRSEQAAKDAALAQKIEADSVKIRNEQLELTNLQMAEQLRDIRLGRSGAPGKSPIVPVRPDLRGSVVRMDGDLVTISIGADTGVAPGAVLDVGRLSPAKYLGRVRILEVSPKEAVGTFEPAGGGRATGDNRPRPGDLISVLN